jgi:hypothetical protein
MRTYQEIKSAVLKKGYVFFEKNLSINLIWERYDELITNHFTDWLHVAFMDNGQPTVISIPATTKPGLKGSILDPITVDGVTGTAVIIPGQYRSAWTFVDSYQGWSKYPYFGQVGPMNYWRDGNKNGVIEHVQEQTGRIFGTNGHRMTNNGVKDGEVNNWSLGCMGSPEPEWAKILPVVRRSAKLYGLVFTCTLMESKDFQ